MRRDPDRLRRRREGQRLTYRMRAEREGRTVRGRTRESARDERRIGPLGKVPCKPLGAALYEQGDDLELVCERVGITSRTAHRWLTEEEGVNATLESAQRVLDELGLLWWEVYDPERWVARPCLTADRSDLFGPLRWIDVVDQAAAAFEGERLIAA